MEVEELIKHKRILESEIMALLRSFESTTDICVESIDISWGYTKKLFEESDDASYNKKTRQIVSVKLDL